MRLLIGFKCAFVNLLSLFLGGGLALLLIAPLFGGLILMVWVRDDRKKKGLVRVPVSERLLRSPGHSLSLQRDEVTSLFLENFLGLITAGLLIGAFLGPGLAQGSFPLLFAIIAIVGYLVCVALGLIGFRRQSKDLLLLRLGLSGELAVGEELNRLMLDGCMVFHDFPADEKWNIDHIIIAPSGVYCVETKARSKRKNKTGAKEHEIVYVDGKLQFPEGFETEPLEQTKRNARWLAKWLSSAVGENIPVSGILTFPGWYVISRTRDQPRVLNPKQIRTCVTSLPVVLTEKQMKQIAHQVDQKCRDVEFR